MAWLGALLWGCGEVSTLTIPTTAVPITIESTAFAADAPIPVDYTCDGANISPPLMWFGVPANAQSLVLIMDDPDAPRGTFVHWVMYNIPPTVGELEAALPNDEMLPVGSTHGKNDFRAIGYGGPCPPSGTHRYQFKLYALDTLLELEPGASKAKTIEAMDGHVVAFGDVTGRYARP